MRKLYAQLYSVRDACEKDFRKTLKDIKDMGYSGVEFAGFYNETFEALKDYMDEIELETLAAHVPLETLKNDLPKTLEGLRILGAKYVVCPMAGIKDRESALMYADLLSKVGEVCLEKGFTLLYHNHAHEIKNIEGEEEPLEIFFEEVDKRYVKQQVDLYWLAYGGLDPVAYSVQHASRIRTVHLKQMENLVTKENVSAGEGMIDFYKIMEKLPACDFIYEQEKTDGIVMEDMKKSWIYLNDYNKE